VVGHWKDSGATMAGLLGFAAACGFCAMVVVEAIKRLLPLRSWFQRRHVAQFLVERSGAEKGFAAMGELVHELHLADGEPRVRESEHRDRDYFVELGRSWATRRVVGRAGVASVFNLPPEQLTGQIGQLVEVPLDEHPPAAPHLMRALATGDRPETAVPVAIDQLHVILIGRWRHYLQATTWWLSGAVGLVVAMTHVVPSVNSGTQVMAALVLGGFFAWLTRDIVAAVERLRR